MSNQNETGNVLMQNLTNSNELPDRVNEPERGIESHQQPNKFKYHANT